MILASKLDHFFTRASWATTVILSTITLFLITCSTTAINILTTIYMSPRKQLAPGATGYVNHLILVEHCFDLALTSAAVLTSTQISVSVLV